MTLKHTLTAGVARAMFAQPVGAPLMLRGPQVTYSPEDDGGAAPAPADPVDPAPADPMDPTPVGDADPADPAGDPAPADPDVPDADADEPKKPKSPVAQLQGRVGHLTKTLHEKDAELTAERQRREALEALFAASGKNPDGTDAPAPKPAAAPSATLIKGSPEWNDAVKTEAKKIAAAEAFNAQCDIIFDEGAKKHGAAFEDGVKTLNALGLMDSNLVQAAIASGAAPDVLNALGADVDEAQRVAALPPIQMAAELTKLATKLSAAKPGAQVSRAPAPITPVGGSVKAEFDVSKAAQSDDMDAYVAGRKAQGSRWAR